MLNSWVTGIDIENTHSLNCNGVGSVSSSNQRICPQGARETRRLATREGWRYQHVQAIIVAIDQYAEAATGNRDYFSSRTDRCGAMCREFESYKS